MSNSGDDRTLDAALAALAGTVPSDADDDARWARRVASRITAAAPMSRRELDPIVAAPFPDDHTDPDEDFDHKAAAADDHGHDAAAAADVGDVRGWEGSMSEDSRPPSSLAGLAGLTRSGPTSHDAMEGAAKGDDSGLIDLRAMNEAQAAAEQEAAPAIVDLSKTTPAVPSAISGSKIPAASTASANAAAPSSAAAMGAKAAATSGAANAPAAASPAAAEKKKGAGLWIALGGLAAAAAIAVAVVPMVARKDEAPAAAQAPPPPAAAAKKADEKVAAADKPAATAPAEPMTSAAPAPEPAPPGAAPGAKAMAGAPGGAATGTVAKKEAATSDPKAAAKPTAAPTATNDPINKPSGGSLDDVLGIGKDQPSAKKADPTEGLPDKPDALDVRSAINAKVSAASGCVKGLDGPSSVSVSFGPSGSVSGVSVSSGPAKGTGAEACIKNAFSSAKVPASKKGATGNATLVP